MTVCNSFRRGVVALTRSALLGGHVGTPRSGAKPVSRAARIRSTSCSALGGTENPNLRFHGASYRECTVTEVKTAACGCRWEIETHPDYAATTRQTVWCAPHRRENALALLKELSEDGD
jgi:hypothetical protein